MVRLYFDHNVSHAVAVGLRLIGVDVLTAFDDNAHQLADPDLLSRATQLGRVLMTHDDDLLVEASRRLKAGIDFAGVIFTHQLRLSAGELIEELEMVAKASTAHEYQNRVLYLPL